MQRTRIQEEAFNLDVSSSGKQIWVFRWRETRPDGRRAPRKRVIGTLEEYPTKKAAENAARGFRLDLVDQGSAALVRITMKELVIISRSTSNLTEAKRAGRTRPGIVVNLFSIAGSCRDGGKQRSIRFARSQSRTGCDRFPSQGYEVENPAIPMSALYNHGIRWEFTDKNPITGPVRGSGVRQSAKRERIPDLLEINEFQLLQAELQIRERILVWLDMTLGLRRGELAGLRWEDIHFQDLTVMAQRSVVD